MKNIYLALKNKEYLEITNEILNNEEFLKRKKYMHHGKKTVYEHSLEVSFLSYRLAKKLKFNYKEAAIGGLLHDFYYEDWHKVKYQKNIFKKHGFVHAKEALENSKKHFNNLLNKKIENIILRHMFPLNIIPPKYKEAWLVSIVDKIISLEVIKSKDFINFFISKRRRKDV